MQTIIEAGKARWFPDFRELFRYRQLLFSLALKDIRVKYAQTVVGLLWAVLNPLITLAVLVFAFNKVGGVDTGSVHPVLFALAGLVTWNYFSVLFSEAGMSLVGNQQLVKKIYFPRLIIPLSKAISGLLDLAITLILFLLLFIFLRQSLLMELVYLPFFILLVILSGWAGGIWMSALTIRFRDFQFVIPLITRIGMFVTPIAFPVHAVPERYQSLMYLNPLTGSIAGFRWAALGSPFPEHLWISILVMLLLLVSGVMYFAHIDKNMADII